VNQPRHIEVQVFGDGTRAVHLFERDCSLQRRHQKVIEEAPAHGMTAALREAMGAAALRAAQAIGYAGAGTVEFIVDGSDGLREDGFFFMEMNTRLQVEHPVTEAITGVDLVEWQLRVAAGEPLPMAQEELTITGHAFEARLYAEDVPAGFLPATGRLGHLAFPPQVRADSGVRAGDTISPFYDPMIAKLIVHGPTRAVALARLKRGLAGTQVAGTVTNLAFLGALASHDGFGRGEVDTGLIGRDIEGLTQMPVRSARHLVAAGMAALGLFDPAPDSGFVLWQPLRQRIVLMDGDLPHELFVEVSGRDAMRWDVGGETLLVRRNGKEWQIGGQAAPEVAVDGLTITVFEAYGLAFEVVDPLERTGAAAGDGNLIEAPMPGLVKMLDARAGQAVTKGDRLAVLEAMKMEHSLLAARDGVVAEVLASAGDQVEAGAALIRLEAET
jgi:3-methylcrotonyl-CoA carboxylase alpha subunit